jgi:hypothetical protein
MGEVVGGTKGSKQIEIKEIREIRVHYLDNVVLD